MTRSSFLKTIVILLLYASIVSSRAEKTITVDQSGNGDYERIQDAINSVTSNNLEPVSIMVKPGTYEEKVSVPADKLFITISGSTTDATDTIVTWNQNGNIDKVAAFHVLASDFIAHHLTIQNEGVGAPAVALRVSGDRTAFYGCRIMSHQDTLYNEGGRHFYNDCYIEGDVDFIFGSGASFFESCHLHSIAEGYGVIAAHRRDSPTDDGGFAFLRCIITGDHRTFLGRPWSSYARVIFAYTDMSNVVAPEGWDHFEKLKQVSSAKTFCGQYMCTGPGATTSERVQWARQFTKEEAAPFLTTNFINGNDWIKSPPTSTTLPPPVIAQSPPPLKRPTKPHSPPKTLRSPPPTKPQTADTPSDPYLSITGYPEGYGTFNSGASSNSITSSSCIVTIVVSLSVFLFSLGIFDDPFGYRCLYI